MANNGPSEQPEPGQSARPSPGRVFNLPTKWLIIGGGAGGGVALVLIVVVVLWVSGAFGSLFGGGGGGSAGGGDVLGYIPGDAGAVALFDYAAVLNGDVPDDYVEYMEERGEEDNDFDIEGFNITDAFEMAIDDDDLRLLAFVVDQNRGDILHIAQGNFEFDIIREELEDGLDCADDDYRGFELWECPQQEYPAAALFEKDKFAIIAAHRQDDLENMLTYKSRTPGRLASAEGNDIKRLLERTGGGWMQIAFIAPDCPISRCQGFAFALGKSDDSKSIPVSYAVMFSSERAAAATENDITIDDLIEGLLAGFDLDLDIGEVKADDDFIVGTGTAEFVDPGQSRPANR